MNTTTAASPHVMSPLTIDTEVDVADKPKPLSRRQRDMLDIITRSLDEHGRAPTIREIADVMGVASTNGVNDHLNALIKKGYVQLESGVARGVRPLHYADARRFMTRKELLDELDELRARVEELEGHRPRIARPRPRQAPALPSSDAASLSG